MDRLLFKLHYTHQHSIILFQARIRLQTLLSQMVALHCSLLAQSVCQALLNSCPTDAHSVSSLRQNVIQILDRPKVTRCDHYAFQTKYATSNSNRDTGSTSSHCAFKFTNQVFFLPKAAKLANYAKYQRLCDGLFVVFSISFFLARLVFYPFW